jgi:apolipoprotein N-acyltransferase
MRIHPLLKMLLICLGGLLLSFSAPNYGLWFIAWFGLVPLFIVLSTTENHGEAIFNAFLFGFVYNLNYLHWLFSLHPLTWLGMSNSESILISLTALIITSLYNSIYFILFGLSFLFLKYCFSNSNFKSFSSNILITLFWLIIFNKLSSQEALLGFPWTLIEYSQYKNLYIIQIAEYFGSLSISFLLVYFNLVLANLFTWFFHVDKIGNRFIPSKPGDFGAIIGSVTFIAILILGSVIFGIVSLNTNKSTYTKKSKTISVLQGNLPIKATRGEGLNISLARNTYSSLLDGINSELIITPEGSLPTVINSDKETLSWIERSCREKNATFLSGSYCQNKNLNITNCAVIKNSSDDKINYYEKQRLVPFGEYVPFYNSLPDFLKKFADTAIGAGFSKGEIKKPLPSTLGKIGVNICFELMYPEIIRNLSFQKANILINLSDLSWFSNSYIKKQFLSFGVFRAIENRKPLVIASNNGISAFIESTGYIRSKTIPNKNGILTDWVKPNNKMTFYTKYGW